MAIGISPITLTSTDVLLISTPSPEYVRNLFLTTYATLVPLTQPTSTKASFPVLPTLVIRGEAEIKAALKWVESLSTSIEPEVDISEVVEETATIGGRLFGLLRQCYPVFVRRRVNPDPVFHNDEPRDQRPFDAIVSLLSVTPAAEQKALPVFHLENDYLEFRLCLSLNHFLSHHVDPQESLVNLHWSSMARLACIAGGVNKVERINVPVVKKATVPSSSENSISTKTLPIKPSPPITLISKHGDAHHHDAAKTREALPFRSGRFPPTTTRQQTRFGPVRVAPVTRHPTGQNVLGWPGWMKKLAKRLSDSPGSVVVVKANSPA